VGGDEEKARRIDCEGLQGGSEGPPERKWLLVLGGSSLEGIFDVQEDAAFVAEFADVPSHAFRSAMAAATNAMVLDADLDKATLILARDGGMEPAAAAEKLTNGIWAMQRIVERAIAKVGLGEEQHAAFHEHLMANPGQYMNAIQYLTAGRDVSHFQNLARSFLEATARRSQVELDRNAAASVGRPGSSKDTAGVPGLNEESLRAAGFQTSTRTDGTLMLKAAGGNGPWVPAADLLKR
jgi:hypothetical protein